MDDTKSIRRDGRRFVQYCSNKQKHFTKYEVHAKDRAVIQRFCTMWMRE